MTPLFYTVRKYVIHKPGATRQYGFEIRVFIVRAWFSKKYVSLFWSCDNLLGQSRDKDHGTERIMPFILDSKIN